MSRWVCYAKVMFKCPIKVLVERFVSANVACGKLKLTVMRR